MRNKVFTWLKKNKVLLILTFIFICLNILYYPINVYKTHVKYTNATPEDWAEIISKWQIIFFVASLTLYLCTMLIICLSKVKIKTKELKVLFLVLICVNLVLLLFNIFNCFMYMQGKLFDAAYSVLITQFTPTILSVLVYYVARGVIEHKKQETKPESETVFINK